MLATGLDWLWVVVGNFRCLRLVSGGCEWFGVVMAGFGWFWVAVADFGWLWLVLAGWGWFLGGLWLVACFITNVWKLLRMLSTYHCFCTFCLEPFHGPYLKNVWQHFFIISSFYLGGISSKCDVNNLLL